MAIDSVPVETGTTGDGSVEARMLAYLGGEDEESGDTPTQAPVSEPDADDEDDAPPSDDVDTEDETPVPQAETRKYKVKVRGEELEVEESELLNGYSRQADYTRDKMALADEKRAVAAERQSYVEKLTATENLLAAQAQEPDWTQLEQTLTPEEFSAAYSRWSIQQRHLDRVRAEKDRESHKLAQDHAAQRQAVIEAEQQRLLSLIPAWTDETVRSRQLEEATVFARKMGYSDEALSQITNAADLLVLHKAAQFDKLEQKAKSAKPVAAGTPPKANAVQNTKPTAVPRVGPTKADTEAQRSRAALKREGTIDAAQRAIMAILGD